MKRINNPDGMQASKALRQMLSTQKVGYGQHAFKNKGKSMAKSNSKETLLFLKLIENFLERYLEEEEEIYYYLN